MAGRVSLSSNDTEVLSPPLPSRKTKLRLVEAQTVLSQRQSAHYHVNESLESSARHLRQAEASKSTAEDELFEAHSCSVSLRSRIADHTFDLQLRVRDIKALERELAQCEAAAAAEQATVESLTQRLRVLENMKGALSTAHVDSAKHHVKMLVQAAGAFRVRLSMGAVAMTEVGSVKNRQDSRAGTTVPVDEEAEGGDPSSCLALPLLASTSEASPSRQSSKTSKVSASKAEDEESLEVLQPGLQALVAELAAIEAETNRCREGRRRADEEAAALERQNQELQAQGARQAALLQAGQADLAALRAQVAGARQQLRSAQRGLRCLREDMGQLETSIDSQQASMHAVSRAFHCQVRVMTPALEAARSRRQGAEQLHAQRMEEVRELSRQCQALIRVGLQPPVKARCQSAPMDTAPRCSTPLVSRQERSASVGNWVSPASAGSTGPPAPLPPVQRPATSGSPQGYREPVLLLDPATAPPPEHCSSHTAPAPALDFNTPELRPNTARAGLGHAGRLVLGRA